MVHNRGQQVISNGVGGVQIMSQRERTAVADDLSSERY